MPRRKNEEPESRVNELIECAESVLAQARLKKDGALSLRALAELRELHLAKAQIAMGVDAEKALRLIDDAALIAEVRRRELSLDTKVTWSVVHDASPTLAPKSSEPAALPEAVPEVGTDVR